MGLPSILSGFAAMLAGVDRGALTEEQAGPAPGSMRTIWSDHPARNMTPERLAKLLLEAEEGWPRAYLELAEDLEERWAHYRSVLGTRRTQVSQLPVTVIAASDVRSDQEDAELVRKQLVEQPWFVDLMFDLLDGVSKGYAVCELVWELSARQWQPVRAPWRDPRWFRVDPYDGTTLRLEDGSPLGSDLPPFKYLIHRPRTKSGLPVRGGLARPASWLYLVSSLTLRDWAVFVHTCGLPIRIGKYGPGASKEDRRTLLKAVKNIAGDAAAIIPASMELIFERIKGEGGKGGDVWERLVLYADQQASKLVLGQTATTDAIAGGHAVGKEHNDVRGDIERSDARQLAATLQRDLIIPFLKLNRGDRQAWPTLHIGRPDQIDLGELATAVDLLVGCGLRLDAQEVRQKAGFKDPAPGAEVLVPPTAPPPVPPPAPPPKRALAAAGTAADPHDAIAAAVDDLLDGDGWQAVAEPLIDPVMALLDDCGGDLSAFLARLPELAAAPPDPKLLETLARLLGNARLAGLAGGALTPGGAPEPGRVRRG